MDILVTGAAGFLGSHLTDRLLGEGHRVIGVDNFSSGSLKNVEHLEHDSRFSLIEHDICRPFDPGPIDYVFNFASPASPPEYLKIGIETLMVGSEGTRTALDIAQRYGAGFLQASTSECYGDPTVHPQSESYWGNVNPVGPRSVYDESKRFGEALVMAYHRYRQADSHIARIFNTYGPRLRPADGRVISNFMSQALRGEPLTIYGDGDQTRSFCYVDDLIEGIYRLSLSAERGPVNIGNPEEYSILECATVVLDVTESTSELVFMDLPQDDPVRRQPDISLATQVLGWRPKIGLREGLIRSMSYFKASIEKTSLEQTASA